MTQKIIPDSPKSPLRQTKKNARENEDDSELILRGQHIPINMYVPKDAYIADHKQQLTWQMIVALFLSVSMFTFALFAAHFLLSSPAPIEKGQHISTAIPKPTATIAHIAGATMAIGSTQSINNLSITLTNLRVAQQNNGVGATAGQEFIIVHIDLRNIDPVANVTYTPNDFVLIDINNNTYQQQYAGLDSALQTGLLLPGQDVQGDVAFSFPIPSANTPDPAVLYEPSKITSTPVLWSVPLGPLLPAASQ